jgi:hypothetical protein
MNFPLPSAPIAKPFRPIQPVLRLFCEVDVSYPPIFAEFDPELHPVGYALALELLGEDTRLAQTADRSVIPSNNTTDQFGWEFNFEAA